MIKLVRVDHRLLHGQVAFSWTNGVGANCILVASDTVVHDDVWKTIKEAKQLVDGCPSITSINLGNTKESKTTTQVSKQVFLEEEEKAILKDLIKRGIECEIRALVDDNKLNVAHVLK